MNKKDTLTKELKKLDASPYQGGISGNSSIKFYRKLVSNGETHYDVWAIWSGRLQPEFIGTYQEVFDKIQEEINLESEFN